MKEESRAFMPSKSKKAKGLQGIQGMDGQFYGISFPVSDHITIGSDPQRCDVIFSSDARDVSSLHCEVIRAGGSLKLVDRGSLYGTYIKGERLRQDEPIKLKPDDCFYLGNDVNKFYIY
jgi:pSer/pThr/pTyr-binding forkhead associated (FHA) protein